MSTTTSPPPVLETPPTPSDAPTQSRHKKRRLILVGVAALIGVMFAGWCVLAVQAGVFIGDRSIVTASTSDPEVEAFSKRKQYIDVAGTQVAYIDEGTGDPVILLHGCPFHSYEWKDVIPRLSPHYRVIAPDLLGLGDTQVKLDDDFRLPKEMEMVVGFMDELGLADANFVTHDHGAATLQLMMGEHPERIRRAVMTNAEAYDQWPSKPEIPYLKLVIHPVLSPIFRYAMQFPIVQQDIFSVAVHNKEAFTDEVVGAYARAHTATPARWQRLVQFFRWQLDPEHNRVTMDAVEGMRRFDRPTLMLWGKQDTNFGGSVAERLAADIPGSVGIIWMEQSAHMPMQEEPEAYSDAVLRFLAGEYDAGVPVAGE